MSEPQVTLFFYTDYARGMKAQAEYATLSSVSLTEKEKYKLIVQNSGTASGIDVYEEGVLAVENGGYAYGITLHAATTSGNMDGYLYVGGGGTAEHIEIHGDAEADTRGLIYDARVHSGGIIQLFSNGILGKCTVKSGGRILSYSSTLSDIALENGALVVLSDSIADTVTVAAGASLLLNNSAILQNAELQAGSSLTLSSGGILSGPFKVSEGAEIKFEANTGMDFVLSATKPGEAAFIEDYASISGTPLCFATVSEQQAAGSYALIGNAAAFNSSLYVGCGDYAMMTLSLGGTGTYHNSVYALSLNEGSLAVNVSDYQTAASADALSWGGINGAESYVLELSNGKTGIALELTTQGVDLLGIANGDYAWRVRNAAESDNWQTGEAFSQTEAPEGPQKLEATTNKATDVFFAKEDGIWGSSHQAKHVGNKGGWAGTGETVELAGKARITDIFAGSEDASILVCSVPGAQDSGIALFLDDIYSTAAGTKKQARLSQINTILATDGADIIDLTSQRFDFAGGVTIDGGAGNDVIWANSGENTLFGGDGDDRIIGGSGNDILIGGAGDDALHGGGGSDIFCFGENWGQDSVSQLSDGTVTLWFSQSNDILQLSFTADGNDTLIAASTGDTIRAVGMSLSLEDCRFGATGHEAEYNTLASVGVFA